MPSQVVGNPDKVSRVTLSAGDRYIQLTIRLNHEFVGGDIVRFPPGAAVLVEGIDELSSTYNRSNWGSGIASGALYAFRSLRIPRHYVAVVELIGRLRAGDVDAVANCAAIAVAKLVGKELAIGPPEGWTVQPIDLQSLADVIAQRGPLHPGDVVRLLQQIAGELVYVHGRPTVHHHRDLRPENIFLQPSNQLHIIDFGIIASTAVDDRRGDAVPPPSYGGEPDQSSARTEDDYVSQLGSLAYFALTRQPISAQSLPLDRVRSDIPPGLNAIIDRSLGMSAGAGFSGVPDMLAALERLRFVPNAAVAAPNEALD